MQNLLNLNFEACRIFPEPLYCRRRSVAMTSDLFCKDPLCVPEDREVNREKPLIVVLGATGLQGGSVIAALQHSSQCQLRGVARPEAISESRELIGQGVDMKLIDVAVASTSELRSLFEGCFPYIV